MRYVKTIAAMALTAVMAVPALAATPAQEKVKERREIQAMCKQALDTLYKEKPELRAKIKQAAGYGCFDSFGVTVIVGGAGGSGIVHDNKTGKNVYMNMGQASAGLNVGVKDYREVLVFNKAETLKKFIDSGWEFSSSAEATAVHEDKGGKKEAAATSQYNTIDVYPMTKTGLALGASVGSRKYWKSDTLN